MLLNCGAGEESLGTARRSNLSILNKITPEYALEGLMLKPDWPPDLKSQLIGNDPDAVKD